MNDPIATLTAKIRELVDGFFFILPNIGIAAVVFALFIAAAYGARRGIYSVLNMRDRRDLGTLLSGFVKWAILLFGMMVAATIIFPSVKPADLFSALGIGSVAIGFAFKDILQNWLSGLLILYRQPFRRGDQIRSGASEGTVEAIQARATVLKTYDGQRVVIPNSDIYTGSVVVRTAFPQIRSEYDLGIGYGDDIEAACDVIRAALQRIEGVKADPAPEAIPWELAGSTVNVRVRWWSDSHRAEVVLVHGRVIAALKRELSAAGIDLPFPTRVVLLHDQTEAVDGDRTRQREGWPAGDNPPAPRRRPLPQQAGGDVDRERHDDRAEQERDQPVRDRQAPHLA